MSVRDIYEVRSRNLRLAVDCGDGKYVGIREKFDARYLFAEYEGHTLTVLRPIGAAVSQDVSLDEYERSIDTVTGREVNFDRPVDRGGKGWYFLDTGEASEAIRPAARRNRELFEALEKAEAEYFDEGVDRHDSP